MNTIHSFILSTKFLRNQRMMSTAAGQIRQPLIKFVGKRSLAKSSSSIAEVKSSSPIAPAAVKVTAVKEGKGVDFATLNGGAWFGRPKFSLNEMEAIDTGGANLWDVKKK